MKFKPHPDVVALTSYLDFQAARYSEAIWHLAHELDYVDGLPSHTMGDGMPVGASDDTSVERAAEARYSVTSQREQLRDDLASIESLARSFGHVIDATLRMYVQSPEAPRCDGRDFSGANLLWVPHSRAADNGWRDPHCTELADASGLCPKCRIRERRWRDEHGLAPRSTSVAEGVRGAA